MDDVERRAEAIRRACLEAAAEAYEDAGLRGLCAEGRFEAALDAVRALDLASATDDAATEGDTKTRAEDGAANGHE